MLEICPPELILIMHDSLISNSFFVVVCLLAKLMRLKVLAKHPY